MDLSPTIGAIQAFTKAQPPPSEAAQFTALQSLWATETLYHAELIATRGLGPFHALSDVNPLCDVRPLFRVRGDDYNPVYDAIRGNHWTEIAKLPINYAFINWADVHTPELDRLKAEISAHRNTLLLSVLPLVMSRSLIFLKGSKTNKATYGELISIGAEGVFNAIDKVPPGTSASTWKSVLIGRILGLQMRYVEDQSLLHLYPTDVRRLYNLRRGRVPEAEHTDDDHELLLIGAAYWPIAATPITGDDWAAKIDPADPGPNALDYLLAKEAQPDEIQADHRRNIAIQRHKLAKRRNAGIKANETRRKKLTPQSVGTCEPDGNLEGT